LFHCFPRHAPADPDKFSPQLTSTLFLRTSAVRDLTELTSPTCSLNPVYCFMVPLSATCCYRTPATLPLFPQVYVRNLLQALVASVRTPSPVSVFFIFPSFCPLPTACPLLARCFVLFTSGLTFPPAGRVNSKCLLLGVSPGPSPF